MASRYTQQITLVANVKTSLDASGLVEPLQLGVKIQNTAFGTLEVFVADATNGYLLPASASAWFPTKLLKQIYIKSTGTPTISIFAY